MSKMSNNQMGTTGQINPIIICGNHKSNQPTQKMQLNSNQLYQSMMSKTSNDKLATTCQIKEETAHQINPSPRDAIEVNPTLSLDLTWRDVQSWSHQQPSIIFPPTQENHKTENWVLSENWKWNVNYDLLYCCQSNSTKQNHKSWKTQNIQWKETLPGTGQCVNWRRARISGALCTANVCRQVAH